MKKIIALILSVCIIGSILSSFTIGIEAANIVSATTIVNNAKSLVGKYPYVWGGESPEEGGFDCSGLVWYVYNQMSGVNISKEQAGRKKSALANAGAKIIGISNFLPGDIVQFEYAHVAIYIGNSTIIEAPGTGQYVKYTTINSSSQVAYAIRLSSITQDSGTQTHSYTRGIEAIHPHREYMMCSCGDYYYTGNYAYSLGYEAIHPHREYYVCEVQSCASNYTLTGTHACYLEYEAIHPHREYYVCKLQSCASNYALTGNYGSTTEYESTYPYKEYYVCMVTGCTYHNGYTGNTAISVTFDPCGGICDTHSMIVTPGSAYGELPVPTRDNYIFQGWYSEPNGKGVTYTGDMIFWGTESVTWYAHWEPDFPCTQSTVTKSGTKHIIETKVYNIVAPYNILIVGYKENRFVTMEIIPHNEQNSPYTLEGDIDRIKVMVWNDLSALEELCDAEEIPSNKWIIE